MRAERSAQAGPFSLRKWYLDCAAEGGALAIAYRAELRWGGLRLAHGSLLVHRPGEGAASRGTLRPGALPAIGEGGAIALDSPRLRLRGRWVPRCAPFAAALYQGAGGGVEWRVHAPRAQVLAALDGERLEGLGYAEELLLTLPPWRLPIDELRWGRFCSASAGLVWLEWRGPEPRRLVLLDGRALDEPQVGEERVRARGASLELGAREVLRSGRIGDTALRAIPALRRAPGRLLGIEETKWRVQARLTLGSGPPIAGEAVHEVVRWP